MNEFEAKKKLLSAYKNNVIRLRRLRDKLDNITDQLGVKSIGYSDMPRGVGGFDTNDLTLEKIDVENRIKNLENKIKEMKSKIIKAIEKLDDDNLSAVIEMHYIDFLQLYEIEDKLKLSNITIKRYIKKAINNIDIDDLK